MRKKDWFAYWDKYHSQFEWIFKEYTLNSEWQHLILARDHEHMGTMITILNKVFLLLPTSKFNERTNPKGWCYFLDLIETNY